MITMSRIKPKTSRRMTGRKIASSIVVGGSLLVLVDSVWDGRTDVVTVDFSHTSVLFSVKMQMVNSNQTEIVITYHILCHPDLQ